MMSSQSTSSYYDIDAILAEEELIPVSNLLNFSHLAHLDPDYVHQRPVLSSKSNNISNNSNNNNNNNNNNRGPATVSLTLPSFSQSSTMSSSSSKHSRKRRSSSSSSHHYLPESTIFKMPLWSIHKWAELNFIQLSLPKHFNRKGREKLETDPVSINLRNKSERYYMAGMALIDLIYHTVKTFDRTNNSKSTSNSHNNTQKTLMNRLHNESQQLKRTLLLTYTGARLRQTLNWTMSSNTEDDVSSYTKKLTEMERRLFTCSADASYAFMMWKLHGSHRIVVSEMALRAKVMNANNNTRHHRNHDNHDGENQNNDRMTKTTTTTPKGGGKGKRSVSARLISPENNEMNVFGIGAASGSRKRMRSY